MLGAVLVTLGVRISLGEGGVLFSMSSETLRKGEGFVRDDLTGYTCIVMKSYTTLFTSCLGIFYY